MKKAFLIFSCLCQGRTLAESHEGKANYLSLCAVQGQVKYFNSIKKKYFSSKAQNSSISEHVFVISFQQNV